MLTRLHLPIPLRLWAALLLAVIGMQAVAPATAALQQTHGSAFSADTYEMAVHRQARNDEPVQIAAMEPPIPVFLDLEHKPDAPVATPAHPRPDPTGPPLHGIRATPSAPRAPPQA